MSFARTPQPLRQLIVLQLRSLVRSRPQREQGSERRHHQGNRSDDRTDLSSPQWSLTDRAVALMDWEISLREISRNDLAASVGKQLEALELTQQQLYTVENVWYSLN